MKKILEKTPWLLAIPITAVSVIGVIWAAQGELDIESAAHLLGMLATLGGVWKAAEKRKQKKIEGEK